ncbi:MAG TPA: hypothetical protein VIT68_03255 [Candidatus Gracilibacteria bacterium]
MTRTLEDRMADMTPWIDQPENRPQVILNDVTLRDGKQALPWWNLWTKEQSEKLLSMMIDMGIHQAEVGFPAVPNDPESESVEYVIQALGERDLFFWTLARAVKSDIKNAKKSMRGASHKGIHTFLGTSPQHRESRRFSTDRIKSMVRDRVRQVKDCGDFLCEFSAEDATRTEIDFLLEIYGIASEEGADVLNIPDTVGHSTVLQYVELCRKIREAFPDFVISTHAHNDMGLAEANALSAVEAGFAQRIEGTLYGIGERAGNTDIMNIIMALMSEGGHFAQTLGKNLVNKKGDLCRLLDEFSDMTGIIARPVSPLYGYGCTTNRSGIHQAEVAKLKGTYVWEDGYDFGIAGRPLFDISPLSGKGGVTALLGEQASEINDMTLFTHFLRCVFSPDVNEHSLKSQFPSVKHESIHALANTIYRVRMKGQNEKETIECLEEMRSLTHDIIRDAMRIYVREIQTS